MNPPIRYLNTWELWELELLLPHIQSKPPVTLVELEQKYNVYGGVPRLCFSPGGDPAMFIKSAATGLTTETLFKFEGDASFADKFGIIPHEVLHFDTVSPFHNASLIFCSKVARNKFLERYEQGKEVRPQLLALLLIDLCFARNGTCFLYWLIDTCFV